MDFPAFCTLFRTVMGDNRIAAPTDEADVRPFFDLTERLLTVNQSLNLTAIRDEQGVVLHHLADSLTLLPYLPVSGSVLDVGCGGGFPSLPLCLCRPDLAFTGLDSTEKKVRYVAETATVLGLMNYRALVGRAEELASGPLRETFSTVTARAVADLPVLCELCLPFVAVGGTFLAMKGAKGEAELSAAETAVAKLGGAVAAVHALALTDLSGAKEKRLIVEIKKERPTPPTFPRPFAKIQKKPL